MKLIDIFESDDESALPDDTYKALESEMQTLAQDENKQWPNALSLVHEAYKIVNVERPTPAMRAAWIQYEELIAIAVRYLAKYQPEGNWRVTQTATKIHTNAKRN